MFIYKVSLLKWSEFHYNMQEELTEYHSNPDIAKARILELRGGPESIEDDCGCFKNNDGNVCSVHLRTIKIID